MARFEISTIVEVLDKSTAPLRKIGAGFAMAGKNIAASQRKFNQSIAGIKRFGGLVSGAGMKMTAGLTLPILGAGGAALKTFADFEMLTANFITMFEGNTKAAKEFLAQVEKMSAATPYTTTTLAKNAQTMMSFGMSSTRTMKVLQQLGDVAGGNTDRMNSLSLAFAQVSSAGKLSGQDLLQMINAGFNPLQQISKKTGRSIGELKEIMSKGGISAGAVAKAFEVATAKGGLFYKGAERGSLTLSGLFSTLKDAGEKAMRMFGEALKESLDLSVVIPQITKRIQEITKSISDWIKENPELTKTIVKLLLVIATIGPILLIVGKSIIFFASVASALIALKNAFAGLNAVIAANPIIFVATLIALAVFLIIKYWKPISKFFKKLWETIVKKTQAVWKPVFKFFAKAWKKLKKTIISIWRSVISFFRSVGRLLYNIFIQPFVTVWQTLNDMFDKIERKYDKLMKKVKSATTIDKSTLPKLEGGYKYKKYLGGMAYKKVKMTPKELEKEQAEITINVKSMSGTEAIIERMKIKGKMKVKAKTSNYTGKTF